MPWFGRTKLVTYNLSTTNIGLGEELRLIEALRSGDLTQAWMVDAVAGCILGHAATHSEHPNSPYVASSVR